MAGVHDELRPAGGAGAGRNPDPDAHEHPVDPDRVAHARARGISADDPGRLAAMLSLSDDFLQPLLGHCLRRLVRLSRTGLELELDPGPAVGERTPVRP